MAAILFASMPKYANLASCEPVDYISFPSGITLYSPLNRTYASGHLALNLTLYSAGMMGSIDPAISMNYSIDGKYNGSVPLTVSNPGLHIVTNAAGFASLPELSEGSHVLTIYLLGHNQRTAYPKYLSYVESIYFYVGIVPPDTRPPETLILSPSENETFTAANIAEVSVPLNFSVDEKAARLAFSLDGHPNTTIAGNTSLTKLSIGSHSLVVYAWDSAGNAGASETVSFYVETQALFPQTLLVTIVAVIVGVIVGVGLLVHVKKRASV